MRQDVVGGGWDVVCRGSRCLRRQHRRRQDSDQSRNRVARDHPEKSARKIKELSKRRR